MRSENLVPGTHQVVAIKSLHINQTVRPVVHRIEKKLGPHPMRHPCCRSYIDDRTYGIRSKRARHQARRGRYERNQVVSVQIPVVPHLPPTELCPAPFQSQPSRNVSLVVHIGDNDLVPLAERLSDRQTHQPNEGCSVHAKRNFACVARVHEISDTVSGAQNHLIDFTALGVASPSLHIALEQMMIHRIQHHLGHLGTGRVVEEDESRSPTQRWKVGTNGFNRKVHCCGDFGIENALDSNLQRLLLDREKSRHHSLAEWAALKLYPAANARQGRISHAVQDRIQTQSEHMPVSLTSSKVIYEGLKESDVRLVSALPETWLVHLIRMTDEDPEMILVRLAKEEEGVGVSAGAHFAGVKSAMLMQNHGFLGSINGIVSFAHLYKIPLLMLISYRGSSGERDPWQTQGGNVTEPVLRALRIPYFFLDAMETAKKRIRQAQTLAESSMQPVALLLTRDLMWEE